MSDPTKIRGFRNVSTPHQAAFITEGGEAKISQISPRRWKVLPRGGEAYEVSGKQEAIEEARGIATGLTPSNLRELQEKQRRLQSSLLAEPPKKSHAQIKREVDEVLARKPGKDAMRHDQDERNTRTRDRSHRAPIAIVVSAGSAGEAFIQHLGTRDIVAKRAPATHRYAGIRGPYVLYLVDGTMDQVQSAAEALGDECRFRATPTSDPDAPAAEVHCGFLW